MQISNPTVRARVARGMALLLTLLVAAAASGCKTKQKKAIDYNQKIVSFNKRLKEAGEAFAKELMPAIQRPEKTNEANVRKSFSKLESSFKAVKADYGKLAVPSGTEAKNLDTEYKRFLKEQGDFVARIGKVVDILFDKQKAHNDKLMEIQKILKTISADENKSLKRLRDVQRKFAKAHKITLIE